MTSQASYRYQAIKTNNGRSYLAEVLIIPRHYLAALVRRRKLGSGNPVGDPRGLLIFSSATTFALHSRCRWKLTLSPSFNEYRALEYADLKRYSREYAKAKSMRQRKCAWCHLTKRGCLLGFCARNFTRRAYIVLQSYRTQMLLSSPNFYLYLQS